MNRSDAVVDVVASVVVRPDGHFLLASRPDGKPYAGYWEFPGGKVEAGESLLVGASSTRRTDWALSHPVETGCSHRRIMADGQAESMVGGTIFHRE